jgi:hypothetical protein
LQGEAQKYASAIQQVNQQLQTKVASLKQMQTSLQTMGQRLQTNQVC